MNQDEMTNVYRGPSKDAPYQECSYLYTDIADFKKSSPLKRLAK
jgi:hypothetical protein